MINGYSVNDWTLGVLYRAHSSSSIWLQAAGIWQVSWGGGWHLAGVLKVVF
jgi:hypothetical protein